MKKETLGNKSGVSQCSMFELKLGFMEFLVSGCIVYNHFHKTKQDLIYKQKKRFNLQFLSRNLISIQTVRIVIIHEIQHQLFCLN
jgi:hypothetical protein